mmetsp:Transcript_70383/g.132841  ORF Transcript_70383/g.132841 Transcript_70383/m.132841 type:complete len:234 (-) Transcript_70383:85-786(-)
MFLRLPVTMTSSLAILLWNLMLVSTCKSDATSCLQVADDERASMGPASSLLQVATKRRELINNTQPGTEKALIACFGENYKSAGAAISHCFKMHDKFNTCCMMDQKMRQQIDADGSTIGQASLAAHRAVAGSHVPDSPDLLTPWCTDFYMQDCSSYAEKTSTKVKFVNNCGCGSGASGKGFCLGDVPTNEIKTCEAWARTQFQMLQTSVDKDDCASLEGHQEVDISTCKLPAK